MTRFVLALALVALALALAPAPAHANAGRADFPGARPGEPGGLREVAIEREELTFDLRPLADRGAARIAATYHLDNRSSAIVTAPLVFVSATRLDSIDVMFDGKSVREETLSPEKVAAFPASWRAPLSTPSIDGGGPLSYETEDHAALAFTLEIPPGPHTLVVTYAATPQMTRSHGGPTILWQLGYVLAPARDWGSFGTLDVTVDVPTGWRVAVSPQLSRTGDTLRGKFPALPGDTLGITAQAPTEAIYTIGRIVMPLLVLVIVIAGIYGLFRIGRARGRSTHVGGTGMLAFVCGLGWAFAIAVVGGLAAMTSFGIPAGQSAAHGYSGLFGLVLAVLGALLAVPIGFAIVKVGVRRGEGSHATSR